MFPKRKIKLISGGGTSPREKFITDETTGITTEIIEDCNKPLPSAEMFKIKNQIKAGINLQEVKTDVISNVNTQTINNEIETITKKRKTSKTNEVNNEK